MAPSSFYTRSGSAEIYQTVHTRRSLMKKLAFAVAAAFAATAYTGSSFAQEKTIRITGFGAKSGVVRSFGINSEAAMLAAADVINKQGGVTLAGGSKAKIAVDFLD